MKTVEAESEILVKAAEREVLVALKRFAKVVDASSPVGVHMRCDRNKMDCMPGTWLDWPTVHWVTYHI